jgi:type VI secretion system protein ImpE
MNAAELYREGRLSDAVAAAADEVKRHPTDSSRRGFLAELLCFAGELERADKQLDALGDQDPQAAVGVALIRQLIRAEQARQQFFAEGRAPELLDAPPPRLKQCLEASVAMREGRPADAAALLDAAEAERPNFAGTREGKPFEDFRDIDDLTASFFEVLTSTGKYFWIPMERVELVEFREPARPRDLLWRRAHMAVRGGPDGEVYLPTLYPGSVREEDEQFRLGRMTDWRGGEGSPVRGVGQRMFAADEEDLTIMEIKELTFVGGAESGEGSAESGKRRE